MIVKDYLNVKEVDMMAKDPAKPSIKILNKVFSKISRIYAKSMSNKVEMVLDINSDLFNLKEGDAVEILIEDSPFELKKDENSQIGIFNLDNIEETESIKNYEYVMHGTIFHSGIEENRVFVYASFGGLLMKYFGEHDSLTLNDIKLDKKILLLMKKYKK